MTSDIITRLPDKTFADTWVVLEQWLYNGTIYTSWSAAYFAFAHDIAVALPA